MRRNKPMFFGVCHAPHRRYERGMQPLDRVMSGGETLGMRSFRDMRRVLENIAKRRRKQSPPHPARHISAGGRMVFDPMPRDVDPGCYPNLIVASHIIQKPSERGGTAGAAHEAAMQADGQHLRADRAFFVKHVEGIPEIGEKLVSAVEALGRGETHVVGIERIGHDQVLIRLVRMPIGKIVGVGIGAVEKSAVLDRQRQRVFRRSALIEAQRTRARDLFVHTDRVLNMRPFLGGGEILVFDPFQTVTGDFPTGPPHRIHRGGIAGQRGRHPEHRDRHVARGEHVPQAPKPGARAVFVNRFHVHVPLAGPGRRAYDLRQEGFRRSIAVQDIVLAAFFVIDDELHGDPSVVGPVGAGRIASVAGKVAWIVGHFGPHWSQRDDTKGTQRFQTGFPERRHRYGTHPTDQSEYVSTLDGDDAGGRAPAAAGRRDPTRH